MRIVVAACLIVLAGCKDKPKTQTATPAATGESAQPRMTPKQDGSDAPSVLVLPKPTGTPPRKTTKLLDIAALAALEFKSFTKDIRRQDATGVDIRYTTEARPKIAVTVSANGCFKCQPMVLATWQQPAVRDGLRNLLAPELRELPDTQFELGATALANAPVIFTYQTGYLNGPDPTGAQSFAYSNAYAAYYNDGVNMIRVVAEYKDDAPASRDDMLRLAPREDLERIALAFLDAYTHAW